MSVKTYEFDEHEVAVIKEMAAELELTEEAVLRQALRYYQKFHRRTKEGETMSFSGDEDRARAFAGCITGTQL